jgi:hypothetical protein
MKPNRLAVFGLAAGLLGGGAAGLALTGSTLASAQVSDVTGTVTDSTATTGTTAADSGNATTTADPAAPATPAPADGAVKPPKGDWEKSVLDGLVAKGTISQAQADEILAALNAARPAHGPGGPGGRGHGPGFGNLDAAAKALGISIDDLRSALDGGKSLAAVAKEKGVDVAKVVDAFITQFKAHLDQEVASGIHTQAEADRKLADARSRIESFVNGTAPAGGPGFGGGRHGHGPDGFGGPPPAGAPAGGSTSGTTTS